MPPLPHSIVTLVAAAALFAASGTGAEPPIPYSDALAAAAVSESKISDIHSLGLVVGNGELNAIVYSSTDNDLHLRLSKNDCWDMRIDTQDDPPLPVVDVAAGKAIGAHGNAGSWTHPYSRELPNGLFDWKGHGVYISEQVAVACLVNELLLQSVGDTIRLFPAWPAATDARFANLLAYGGFEVSAEQTGGKIANIRVTSTVGGPVKMVSPWGQPFRVVAQAGGPPVPVTTTNDISSFATDAGQTYGLERLD